jgi:hypothetical protein
MNLLTTNFSAASCLFLPPRSKYSPHHVFNLCPSLSVTDHVLHSYKTTGNIIALCILICTQSPIQWVSGALSRAVKRPGLKLATHLNLLPRSRMRGAMLPLPNTPSLHDCQLKHRDNFTFTLFSLVGDGKIEDSELNGSRHFPHLMCS